MITELKCICTTFGKVGRMEMVRKFWKMDFARGCRRVMKNCNTSSVAKFVRRTCVTNSVVWLWIVSLIIAKLVKCKQLGWIFWEMVVNFEEWVEHEVKSYKVDKSLWNKSCNWISHSTAIKQTVASRLRAAKSYCYHNSDICLLGGWTAWLTYNVSQSPTAHNVSCRKSILKKQKLWIMINNLMSTESKIIKSSYCILNMTFMSLWWSGETF